MRIILTTLSHVASETPKTVFCAPYSAYVEFYAVVENYNGSNGQLLLHEIPFVSIPTTSIVKKNSELSTDITEIAHRIPVSAVTCGHTVKIIASWNDKAKISPTSIQFVADPTVFQEPASCSIFFDRIYYFYEQLQDSDLDDYY